MITINVIHRSLTFPWKRKKKTNMPQNWGEVNAGQLRAIIELYSDKGTELSFLKEMTGLRLGILKKMSAYERFKLMEILEFVANHKLYHQFIIRKVYPTIISPALFAPQGKLKGVSFGQFIFCDSYFSSYQDSKDPDDLSKFIASLYLRKNEKFDEKIIADRYKLIGNLDENTRQSIVLNYQLMHEWLTEAYPLIFQKVQQLDIATDGVKAKRNPNNWIKVFQNFVGDDIIHDHLWAEKPVNTIFSYMTRKYKESLSSKSNKY